jgi:antitoxin (DNA-binding transcriptional repressor) of toxin-antitoxin stability system
LELIVYFMKTTSVQQGPQQWAEIMSRVASGEEVGLTLEHQLVAKIVPVVNAAPTPDFLARAKTIWGAAPAGKPLSAIVAEARGDKQV